MTLQKAYFAGHASIFAFLLVFMLAGLLDVSVVIPKYLQIVVTNMIAVGLIAKVLITDPNISDKGREHFLGLYIKSSSPLLLLPFFLVASCYPAVDRYFYLLGHALLPYTPSFLSALVMLRYLMLPRAGLPQEDGRAMIQMFFCVSMLIFNAILLFHVCRHVCLVYNALTFVRP